MVSMFTHKPSFQDRFEAGLVAMRALVYIPVVVLVIASGAISVWAVINFGLSFDITALSEKELLIGVISMIDTFLLSILTLIIAISLYELYISPISEHKQVPQSLIISSIDELKNKLAKVVYMILVVAFFKEVIQYNFSNIFEIVLLALGILLLAMSLYFVKEKKEA